MATPQWIRKVLQLRGVRFEELHHPEVYTSQEVAQREHFTGHRVAKVVVVMVDERPVELILPASRHVVLERVREILNAKKVRLASEKEMEKYFDDCEIGAIPALRHWQGIDVLMDRSLTVEGDILFQAGTHSDAVKLNFRDWYELVQPQVATFSKPEELAPV
jgi:Ala-tRNA(Pro) deacylase